MIEERDYYPVSSAQKRIFVLNQLEGISTSYNMSGAMNIEGELDIEKLEFAFKKVIQRHESLRTSFELISVEPVQRVHKHVDFNIEYSELGEDGAVVEAKLKEFVRPFDLSTAPLLRVGLIHAKDINLLLFDMHHIISDGMSMNILIKEITELYEGDELPELRIQYKDVSAWQNELINSEYMRNQEEYWLHCFDEIPVLNMATDFSRPAIMSFEGDSIDFTIDNELTFKLHELAKETGTTLYMVLLAIYNVLLSKYSGQEDIIVGSPIAGRPHADLEKIIGIFINTLAMRNYPAIDKSFTEFLSEVKENSLKAYEHQDYPFETLVEKLEMENNLIQRDLSRNPLFDTMFVLQNTDKVKLNLSGVKFIPYELERNMSQFDLTLNASESSDGIKFNLEYCTKLFKKSTIERIARHFVQTTQRIVSKPEILIGEIDIISDKEKNLLLYEFNETNAEYSANKTIPQIFEEQVEQTPDHIALVFNDKKMTYKELNERSNQLAAKLRVLGVIPDQIVGIMIENSFEMIIGLLGILKAGGAYLPIDPEYPEERIEYLLNDSQTKILLTQRSLLKDIQLDGEVIDLEDERNYSGDSKNLTNINSANDLAYIIYTSGSNWETKGVND